MTDVSSVKAHAETQPASVALYAGPPPPPAFSTIRSPTIDGTIDEEDSSTIKCICGFSDDDGNTVLCEKCDTWQHIVCYYESPHHVPDVHECNDCVPRLVDTKSATEKQRLRRELHSIGERKGKPKGVKNHKKRVKDPLGAVQPNGWAVHSNNDLHYNNADRKSGSPRDQPPPNKRPKTSHRSSNSVSVISSAPALAPASRKRGSSVMFNGHSPVKSPSSPDGPIEDFSLEFMNLYRPADPPRSTDSNSYTTLNVPRDIASWLTDREALATATGGKKPGDVFTRMEKTISDLDSTVAPVITKQTEVDATRKAHGLHPQWHFITVEAPVAEGGYIGELKGLIGRKEEYFADPANRWDLLRHPEPFVFFPPHLPVYIDTRGEGNILRYARRSCSPNMAMKILVEDEGTAYHFCFLAMRQIEPGEELTVGWDIDSEVKTQLVKGLTNGDIKKEGFRTIQPWVACVLANFGGCACDTSTGHECLLERARRNNNAYAEPAQPVKSTKGRKPKKSQVSPLSTGHATNSRAGSETFPRDAVDDDNMDGRSTSGSHKSTSRDITPATHFSVDGDLKMSDRERRKLQQQERLFEQLEYDEQHKGKRGKRNSAGSTLNTPSLSSSKQLGHLEPSPSARGPREHSHGVARKTSGSSSKTNGRVAPKPKPVYTDASTQTEDDKPTPNALATVKTREMRPPMSFKRKLLQQAQEDKLLRERIRSTSVKVESKSPALKDVSSSKASPDAPSVPLEEPTPMDISTETAADPVPKPESKSEEQPDEKCETKLEDKPEDYTPEEPAPVPVQEKEPTPPPSADVEMKDADDEATVSKPPEPKVEEMPDAPNPDPSSAPSDPPAQPPAPPWPPTSAEEPSTTSENPQKPPDIHLEVPAKPDLTNSLSSPNSAIAPGVAATLAAGNGVVQSPVSATSPSPFSPSVTNSVNPGPARKKLSLSDYTKKRAKLAQSANTSSPSLAQSQTTSSPTLSTASLPNSTSPSGKGAESTLSTVTEDPKPIPPAATASTST